MRRVHTPSSPHDCPEYYPDLRDANTSPRQIFRANLRPVKHLTCSYWSCCSSTNRPARPPFYFPTCKGGTARQVPASSFYLHVRTCSHSAHASSHTHITILDGVGPGPGRVCTCRLGSPGLHLRSRTLRFASGSSGYGHCLSQSLPLLTCLHFQHSIYILVMVLTAVPCPSFLVDFPLPSSVPLGAVSAWSTEQQAFFNTLVCLAGRFPSRSHCSSAQAKW